MATKKKAKPAAAPAEVDSASEGAVEPDLTCEQVRALLHYEPSTGAFTWLVQRGRQKAGAVAGSIKTEGYREIGVAGRLYYAHRLAWLWVHGRWPTDQLDHINGVESDNRLANLRECTNAENCQNLGRRKNNTSGVTGVYWNEDRAKWQAQIRDGGRIRALGRFPSIDAAERAYLDAKQSSHQFQPTPRQA